MSTNRDIEHPSGVELSDGATYRCEYQHGYGARVYRDAGDIWVYCGQVLPESYSDEAMIAAVERMIRE